jgi:intracellular sulfur oxidation DsrE/DsrF family protein
VIVRPTRRPQKQGGANVKKDYLFRALVVASLLFGSTASFADGTINTGIVEPCSYPPIVGDPSNSDICVDVPVNLHKAKVVFNNNLNAIVPIPGNPNAIPDAIPGPIPGTIQMPIALLHMVQLGGALQNRINSGLMQPQHVSVIGVFHGKDAASWLLGDAWWKNQTNPATSSHYTGNPYKSFIEKIFALKSQGVNIQLEICGVTMHGNGWTNTDVYTSPYGKIYVNQGAVGRLIDLEQDGYVYYQPGK